MISGKIDNVKWGHTYRLIYSRARTMSISNSIYGNLAKGTSERVVFILLMIFNLLAIGVMIKGRHPSWKLEQGLLISISKIGKISASHLIILDRISPVNLTIDQLCGIYTCGLSDGHSAFM
jgi:hypothetical protein